MGRPVPTTTDPCDGCGASEADDVLVYDFMGDCYCDACLDDEPEQTFKEEVAEFASKLDRVPQEIKDMSGVPSAVIREDWKKLPK